MSSAKESARDDPPLSERKIDDADSLCNEDLLNNSPGLAPERPSESVSPILEEDSLEPEFTSSDKLQIESEDDIPEIPTPPP